MTGYLLMGLGLVVFIAGLMLIRVIVTCTGCGMASPPEGPQMHQPGCPLEGKKVPR